MNSVVFKLSNTGTVHPANLLILNARFAISGGGVGGITRTVTNVTLRTADVPGIKAVATHTLPSAVKAVPALKEVIVANELIAPAMAKHEFMSFATGADPSDDLVESVGTVHLTVAGGGMVADQFRLARANAALDTPESRATTLVSITGDHETEDGELNNSVTFSGDFSFVKSAGFSGADCSTITEVRKESEEDPEVYTDEIVPQSAASFVDAPQSLCIEVDGETPIPDTGYYMVTTKYKGLPMAAFPPVGGTHSLARIERDGYDANIPYMTTHSAYNQRVVIVNRWRATTYTFGSFESEDGVEVTGGIAAEGILPEGTTVLRMRDIITIEGGNRASGSLTVVAPEYHIDAAVQQVTLESQAVDTVYLD